MKVLIISPGYLPITGDHGGAIENLINIYLNENDIKHENDIVVYTVNSKFKETKVDFKHTTLRIIDKNSKVYKVRQKLTNLKAKFIKNIEVNNYYNEVIKDLKKRREENLYDIIIFQNGQDHIINFRKKIKTNSKVVLHLHNDYLNKEKNNAREKLHSFDEVWTVSDFIGNRVKEIDKKYKNVKTLYNTIDFDRFKKVDNKVLADLKVKFNIKEDDFIFIYVGRVTDGKGTLEMTKAFNKLNRKYKNTKLLIVGGTISLSSTDEYYEKVKAVADKNINIILTGQINNKELAAYYQISNVQIIPSKWNEAFGLIALEGIACNLPIISSSKGGLPEVMGEDCLYINPKNMEKSIYENMEFFYNNREISKKYLSKYKNKRIKFSKTKYCETMNKYIRG